MHSASGEVMKQSCRALAPDKNEKNHMFSELPFEQIPESYRHFESHSDYLGQAIDDIVLGRAAVSAVERPRPH